MFLARLLWNIWLHISQVRLGFKEFKFFQFVVFFPAGLLELKISQSTISCVKHVFGQSKLALQTRQDNVGAWFSLALDSSLSRLLENLFFASRSRFNCGLISPGSGFRYKDSATDSDLIIKNIFYLKIYLSQICHPHVRNYFQSLFNP